MPMDYVCEDMRTDLPSPSFPLSVSSSPLPLMAALCDEGMDTKFEGGLMNHVSPTMPDLPLYNTQEPCLVLRKGSPQDEALSDTSGIPLSPQTPGNVYMGSPRRVEKGQAGTCQVCGETASGNFFGALVCLPCKSFFIRCTKDGGPVFLSQCQGMCNVSKKGRNRCQQCRFLKCQAAGMSRKEKPEAIEPGEGQILCRVCGDIANGIHFGVFTCEGCKKFFRRGLLEYHSYACKGRGTCTLNPRNRNNCRYCRYQKCLHVGMSRRAIKMGRPKKLNKDLEGVLLTVSQSHEINSSSAFNPRIALDTMAGIEDHFTPPLEEAACRDEDINPVFRAMSSECNSPPNENHELFGTWKRYDNSRGALPLKKGILRSMPSRDQETVVRDEWNENGMSDEMIFIEDDEVDKSDEMYNHHCSSTSSVVKSERDSLHVELPAGCVGSDRRKERRRRRKSESPSYFNIAADTQPGLKRWKSDTDSPASFFRYSASDFSAKTSESNFQLNDTSPSLHSRPSKSEDKPYRAQKPVDLSLLTCFERRWKNRTYRNPVTCFSIHPLDKQQLPIRGHHYKNRPLYNHRSPVPSHASPHESESLLYNSKTTRTERKERIDDVSSTPTSQINMNTDECFSQTQRTESCSNKNITQTIVRSTNDAKGDSRPIKDDDTPKQTIDGFLISKKNLEEIDHFFLSSMSLLIDIQRRLKASCEDTEKTIQSPISKEPKLSLRNQETGSGSPEPPLSCSLGKSTEIGRLSPTGQQSTVREQISRNSSHTSGTKTSSSPSRRQMSDSGSTPSPSELTSSELVQIQEDRGLVSPKGGKLSPLGHLPPRKRLTPSPIGHTPSSLGHTPSPLRSRRRTSGHDSNELPSTDGTSPVHPGELKTSERLDTEYRFPAVRVVKYWNQVTSSSQDVQMSVQEHRVLQDMLEAYMEMLKNLDESHMDTDQHVNNLQDWPREGSSTLMEHVVRRIVRQVKEELAFMVKVPGFNDFHPDDRIFIIQNICFANVTLMATRDWYDPGSRTFRNMMNWKLPEFHPMYTFRLNAMDLGDQITLLKMDRTEAAMLSALNVTATDISGLREPEIIEKSRDFLMSALASHLSYKGLDPEARMKELFTLMPIFRLCGFWTKSLREQIALNRQPNV